MLNWKSIVGASVIVIALVSPVAVAQDAALDPTSGVMPLSGGFTPDPRAVALTIGGGDLSAQCAANIHAAPDVLLTYSTSGSSNDLIISVGADADTSLLVRAPNGGWSCDDDSGETGANPALTFTSPTSGDYAIWIGGPVTPTEAELSVSATTAR